MTGSLQAHCQAELLQPHYHQFLTESGLPALLIALRAAQYSRVKRYLPCA